MLLDRGDSIAQQLLRRVGETPNAVQVVTVEPTGDLDCVDLGEEHDDRLQYWLRRSEGSDLRGTLFWEQKRELARRLVHEDGISLEEASEAVALTRACEDFGFDSFATSSPVLLSRRAEFEKANVMTPEEAVALVGLYLRSRDEFRVPIDNGQRVIETEFAFMAALHDSLPRLGTIIRCCAVARGGAEDHINRLVQTLTIRMVRAFRARDHVNEQYQLPQGYKTGDEAAYHLEFFLLCVYGEFDTLARLVNAAYGLPFEQPQASWRHTRWLEEVRTHTEDLAAYASRQVVQDTLALLAKLRNLIHSEAVRTMTMAETGHEDEAPIWMSEEAAPDLLELSETLGGHDRWGVVDLAPGYTALRADRFVETAIAESLKILDELMARIDQSLLPAPSAPPEEGFPPFGRDMWGEETRQRTIMLVGVG